MNVVAVQLNSVWEDVGSSQERVSALLERERPEPGSLVILPEMFATGFSMNVAKTAQSESREVEAFLRRLAQQYDVAVLAGVVGPLRAGVASNEAVAYAPDGSLLARYRKLQPFTPAGEDRFYGAGSSHVLFTWQGVRIAPFICYDLRFPEHFRQAAADGAELLVVIASWPALRSEHWVRLLQARAIENQAFSWGVNRCGHDPALHYDGRSCGFDPLGVPLFEADATEQAHPVQIDPSVVTQWRSQFPALKDMKR